MKVYYLLVSVFCVWINPTHSQFLYSHYTPLVQVSPFFPQTFLPQLPPVSPLAYTLPQSQPISTSTASVTYNIPATSSAEFRGFGYRTDYKDGASSTVFYVNGPGAENLRNLKNYPNLATRIQETSSEKARSLASDITDGNAVTNTHEKIQRQLQPEVFGNIFNNIKPGLINFYTFPAGIVPLHLTQDTNENVTANATTTTPSSEEPTGAESVVDSSIVINDVNIIKSNNITETTTPAAETSSTTSTNDPTQSSDSTSIDVKEATPTDSFGSNAEATTIESTTQQ